MIGVPELGASEYTALCDASQPSTRDDDVIDGLHSPIRSRLYLSNSREASGILAIWKEC